MSSQLNDSPRGPITYIISYTPRNSIDDAWAERMAASPPDVLHHGHDVPLNNLWGPTRGYSAWEPDPKSDVDDVRRKIEELRRGIDRLHNLGVRYVIPYTNPSIIGGNPAPPDSGAALPGGTAEVDDAVTGFFRFWQRSPKFREIGLDLTSVGEPPASRNSVDPMDWMQRDRMSFAMYNPKTTHGRYEPCLRREPWLRWMETVTQMVAEAGYDGTFADDNLVQCMCPVCQHDFRRFLATEYADRIHEFTDYLPLDQTLLYSDDGCGILPAMRRPTSGKLSVGPPFADPSEDVAKRWATLVWQASQAFWSETNADNLYRMREAGRRVNSSFFVIANWGVSASVRELGIRRKLGHDVRRWTRGAQWQMLEENRGRGYIAPGLVADFWTPCRVMAAYGAEPALLSYHGSDPRQVELSYAEIASASCGAFVGGESEPDVRRAYRAFFHERAELFEDAKPYGPVGIYYSFDEIQRNNEEHLLLFYAVARALGRSHVPFDVIPRESLVNGTAELPRVLINPAATDLPTPKNWSRDQTRIITIGRDGESPSSMLASEEIALDNVLGMNPDAMKDALSGWSHVDLCKPAPIARIVESVYGMKLALTDDSTAHAVRLRVFQQPEKRRAVIHIVNYGHAPLVDGSDVPSSAPSFTLRVPAACTGTEYRHREVDAVWTEGPGIPRETLNRRWSDDDTIAVDIPPTDVYRVVVVTYR